MPEEFRWIRGGALGPLAAFWHRPEGNGPFPAVLFCHGFTGTRVEPQRLFLNFSRRLSVQGIASLRFDFGGHGESAGDFKNLTLEGELQDARTAWDFLSALPDVAVTRRALLGFSLGGWVAAGCAAGFAPSGLKALCLWTPVDDPARLKVHFMGLHGEEKLREDGGVDIMAENLGGGFAASLDSFEGKTPGRGWPGPTLLVRGERDETVPPTAADNYERVFAAGAADFTKVLVPGARHLFESPAQRDRLYSETESFLNKHLTPSGGPEARKPTHG